MHTFDFTFDFRSWTDVQIDQLVDLLNQTHEYEKRAMLLDYLHPAREEVVTIVDPDGTQRTYIQIVRD